jgi:choline dehydrogenase-like flavoprotein
VRDDALHTPRGKNGHAPDVFTVGGWMPMREYRQDDAVDFAIVGTGAGGGTLACRLAEQGFRVVAFDAGAWWRPLEEFASDETHQAKLYWTDERLCDGEQPLKLGSNNSGKAVGGSTVHFAMVSLRFRPEWFKSRSLLGYGADWPIDWREMWRYYGYVEDALKISGPVNYPWGPHRPRYPYRAHELNAAALVLARGCEALGIDWCPTPLATISAPRGQAHPCVYRGFCVAGCATNAKQSALVTWIPRAVRAGAEIRDLAMVGRVVVDEHDRAVGVEYLREGRWQFQRARNVVVAGYAIETPRLLLNSATSRFPEGLANRSGLVGKNLMVQANQAVWGLMDEEVRWYKGPPSLAMTEHWNYTDEGKDFHVGYCYMSQGPLPNAWAAVQTGRGLWGEALHGEMEKYNHRCGEHSHADVQSAHCRAVVHLAESRFFRAGAFGDAAAGRPARARGGPGARGVAFRLFGRAILSVVLRARNQLVADDRAAVRHAMAGCGGTGVARVFDDRDGIRAADPADLRGVVVLGVSGKSQRARRVWA